MRYIDLKRGDLIIRQSSSYYGKISLVLNIKELDSIRDNDADARLAKYKYDANSRVGIKGIEITMLWSNGTIVYQRYWGSEVSINHSDEVISNEG